MPICAVVEQAAIVMPDCSELVTTFSRQSCPLQRTATRVTSMATFSNVEDLAKTHAGFMPIWNRGILVDADDSLHPDYYGTCALSLRHDAQLRQSSDRASRRDRP